MDVSLNVFGDKPKSSVTAFLGNILNWVMRLRYVILLAMFVSEISLMKVPEFLIVAAQWIAQR
jgi:hypothetical protein